MTACNFDSNYFFFKCYCSLQGKSSLFLSLIFCSMLTVDEMYTAPLNLMSVNINNRSNILFSSNQMGKSKMFSFLFSDFASKNVVFSNNFCLLVRMQNVKYLSSLNNNNPSSDVSLLSCFLSLSL